MSYAFIKTMRASPQQSYINASSPPNQTSPNTHLTPLFNNQQVLQNTRVELSQKYSQIPQLSVGGLYNLEQMVSVSLPLFPLPPLTHSPLSCPIAP